MSIVLSAPQAIITVTDPLGQKYVLGRVRSLQINESYQRDPVYGIGSTGPQEIPLVRWAGQVTVDEYA